MENKEKIGLIIPACSDLNRGDQALVIETMNVMKKSLKINDIYMMSNNEITQCERFGLKPFKTILKHPSRLTKKSSNIKYNSLLKIKWGFIAVFDFLTSMLIMNKITRAIVMKFASKELKKSLTLYKNADAIFVKGGGFMHDYSGGLVGRYTMYYQVYHIQLALKMKKKVYILPNSFGPYKNKRNVKFLNKILDQCQFVSARESISADGKTNGLGRDIPLYPDLGFFLEGEDKEKTKKYLKEKYHMDIEKQKYIAITARPYRFYEANDPEKSKEDYIDAFAKIAKYIYKLGYIPLLVVHTRAQNSHENDEVCIKQIIERMDKDVKYIEIKDDSLTCKDLKTIYSFCDAIIGTRFHSVIFAIDSLVPAIAVTYGGNKGQGIMRDMGLQNYAIKIEELNYTILKQKLDELLKNRDQEIERMKQYIASAKIEYSKMIKEIQKAEEK